MKIEIKFYDIEDVCEFWSLFTNLLTWKKNLATSVYVKRILLYFIAIYTYNHNINLVCNEIVLLGMSDNSRKSIN